MSPERGQALVRLACEAIRRELSQNVVAEPRPEWLSEPGATFVTVTHRGRLRGCIGSIEARWPIGDDVRENAVAAATRDPRFFPLTAVEWPDVGVEVTVLSSLEPLPPLEEKEALERLRPGVDGVVLACGSNKGTFLPQMWEQLPAAREFLGYLKKKAGLPADFWSDEVRLQRFTVEKWT